LKLVNSEERGNERLEARDVTDIEERGRIAG